MKRLVYVSTARYDLSDEDVRAIVERAAEKNLHADVTGLLTFNGANFMQALEGDDSRVDAIYAAIKGDPRHGGVVTLLDEPCEERLFPDWQMRFIRTASGPVFNGLTSISENDLEETAHVGKLFRSLLTIGGREMAPA